MDSALSKTKRSANVLLVLLFLALSVLPILDNLIGLDPTPALAEKRVLSQCPKLGLSPSILGQFPKGFDAFYKDHFGFRNSLVRINSIIHVLGFGVSPHTRFIVGKDDWLYLADEAIRYHRNIKPYSKGELGRIKTILEQRRDWLARLGIRYLFVVAPDKHAIYPEYLPDVYAPVRPKSRLDQLLEYMKQHSDLEILDLSPSLMEAKKHNLVYQKAGSHWNLMGAYVGYCEIVNGLSLWFPGSEVKVAPPVLTSRRESDISGAEHAVSLSLDRFERYYDPLWRFECQPTATPIVADAKSKRQDSTRSGLITVKDDATLPSALMVHDSFTLPLIPLLSEQFRRIAYVRSGTDTDALLSFHPEIVLGEMPNVFIEEVVHRRLVQRFMPNPPRVEADLKNPARLDGLRKQARQRALQAKRQAQPKGQARQVKPAQ